MGYIDLNEPRRQRKLNIINNIATIAVFIITIINILIAGFGINSSSGIHKWQTLAITHHSPGPTEIHSIIPTGQLTADKNTNALSLSLSRSLTSCLFISSFSLFLSQCVSSSLSILMHSENTNAVACCTSPAFSPGTILAVTQMYTVCVWVSVKEKTFHRDSL